MLCKNETSRLYLTGPNLQQLFYLGATASQWYVSSIQDKQREIQNSFICISIWGYKRMYNNMRQACKQNTREEESTMRSQCAAGIQYLSEAFLFFTRLQSTLHISLNNNDQ